jgi:hypothetical protein
VHGQRTQNTRFSPDLPAKARCLRAGVLVLHRHLRRRLTISNEAPRPSNARVPGSGADDTAVATFIVRESALAPLPHVYV